MEHNARSNYLSADAAGDEAMKRDIILSEIAKLIVKSPEKVLSNLKASGVKVNGNPSNDQLLKIVSQSLMGSQSFAQLIAKDIATANGRTSAMSADSQPQVNPEELLGAVSTITGAIGTIFGGKKNNKDKDAAKKDNEQAEKDLKTKTNTVGKPAEGKSNLTRNIAIGIGIAIVVGGVLWFVVPRK